jgi:hypothetical protein
MKYKHDARDKLWKSAVNYKIVVMKGSKLRGSYRTSSVI